MTSYCLYWYKKISKSNTFNDKHCILFKFLHNNSKALATIKIKCGKCIYLKWEAPINFLKNSNFSFETTCGTSEFSLWYQVFDPNQS